MNGEDPWEWVQRGASLATIIEAFRRFIASRDGRRKGERGAHLFANAILMTYRQVLRQHRRKIDKEFVEDILREGIEKEVDGMKVRVKMGGDIS